MGWFGKRHDPISDRARILNAEIAQLEAQIRKLDEKLQHPPEGPRLRSTVSRPPRYSSDLSETEANEAPRPPENSDPIFEEVNQQRLRQEPEPPEQPSHYNDLGVRKYDLSTVFKRWASHLKGPSTTNPKLVSYLAAGGIQGLRPLRYEKRVARNRFFVLFTIFFLALVGILVMFFKHH